MALADPQYLHTLASALLAAIVDYYAANTTEAAQALPARQYVADGTPAWDCEQVTVHVRRTFAIDGSGQEVGLLPLGHMVRRGAEMGLQVVRCIPTVEGEMEVEFPTAEAIEESARVILTDAEMLADAAVVADQSGVLPGCDGVFFAGWENAEPGGGLGGGTITIRLVLD